MKNSLLLMLAAVGLAELASAQNMQHIETFESGTNPDQWYFDVNQTGTIQTGLGGSLVLSFTNITGAGGSFPTSILRPHNDPNSHWSGDFRWMQVENFAFDFWHIGTGWGNVLPRNLHVVLGRIQNNGGFPAVADDDMAFIDTGITIQFPPYPPPSPMVPVNVSIPSLSPVFPGSPWGIRSNGALVTDPAQLDQLWNDIIQNVDYVAITIGQPGTATITKFHLDFDNIRLLSNSLGTRETFCNGSSIPAPCGNDVTDEAGCGWGAATPYVGGRLRGYGSPSIAAGNAYLLADHCPPGTWGFMFESSALLDPPIYYAGTTLTDGLWGLAQPYTRNATLLTANANGELTTQGMFGLPFPPATVPGTYRYQLFYRVPQGLSPCNTYANMTNTVSITFVQ